MRMINQFMEKTLDAVDWMLLAKDYRSREKMMYDASTATLRSPMPEDLRNTAKKLIRRVTQFGALSAKTFHLEAKRSGTEETPTLQLKTGWEEIGEFPLPVMIRKIWRNENPRLGIDPQRGENGEPLIETVEFSAGDVRIVFISPQGFPIVPGDGNVVRSNLFMVDAPGVNPLSVRSVRFCPGEFNYDVSTPVTVKIELYPYSLTGRDSDAEEENEDDAT